MSQGMGLELGKDWASTALCSVDGFRPSACYLSLPTLVLSDQKKHWCNQYDTEPT